MISQRKEKIKEKKKITHFHTYSGDGVLQSTHLTKKFVLEISVRREGARDARDTRSMHEEVHRDIHKEKHRDMHEVQGIYHLRIGTTRGITHE